MRTNFKWDQSTRFDEAQLASVEAERRARSVARWVDQRDKYGCRACGARTDPHSLSLLTKGHRHHLQFRSAGGETVTSNVCLLCPACHNAVHRHQLRIEGNADLALTCWRRGEDGEEFMARRELDVHVQERD